MAKRKGGDLTEIIRQREQYEKEVLLSNRCKHGMQKRIGQKHSPECTHCFRQEGEEKENQATASPSKRSFLGLRGGNSSFFY